MSFREAKDTLALLGCGNISVSSRERKETKETSLPRCRQSQRPQW